MPTSRHKPSKYDGLDLEEAALKAEEDAYLSWVRLREEKRNSGPARGQKRPLKEQDIQRMIATGLENDGFMVIRVNSSTMIAESGTRMSAYRVVNINSTSGHADLVVYKNGRVWMLEVKRDRKGKQSESQVRFEACCTRYGVPYAVITTLDEARHFIQHHTEQMI
jgi:Holliday junction resolvase